MSTLEKDLAGVIENRLRVMSIDILPSQAARLADTILKIWPPMSEAELEADVVKWQQEKFPGATTDGITQHLHEEMKEFWDRRDALRECTDPALGSVRLSDRTCNPEELQEKICEELADITLLAISYHAALGKSLMESVLEKHRKNLGRIFTYRPELGFAKALTPEEMSKPPAGWSLEDWHKAHAALPDVGTVEDTERAIHIIASIQARSQVK